MDKTYLSLDEIFKDTQTLGDIILKRDSRSFDVLVAVSRGGLVPAGIIAQKLNIRHVETFCLESYTSDHAQEELKVVKGFESKSRRVLVIDDLVDSGKSLTLIKQYIPHATFGVLYAKPMGAKAVNIYARAMPQDSWLVFPWEVEG